MGTPAVGPSRRDYWIIALVSCAVLIYEIAIVRLLSVVLWYHFAFLAISLAMLGLGAPGVWFSLRAPGRGLLRLLLLASAAAIPLSTWIVVKLGEWLAPLPDPLSLAVLSIERNNLKIAIVALVVLIPLLCSGGAVCFLLMAASGKRIGRMYAWDLLGAAFGACLVVPLMKVVPTPQLLAALGFLPLAGVLLRERGRPGVAPLGLAGLILASLLWGEPYQVHYSKSYSETEFDLLYEKWTPTARLTVFRNVIWASNPELSFGWGMGKRFEPSSVEQLWIEQDASAGTPITRFLGSLDELDHLFFDVTSVGYQLRPPKRVCIIGAGGGRDILTALKAGAESVDAVEMNPSMIEVATGVFGEFSGDVYHLPKVRPHASEGRSFLTRTEREFDLIQISLVDSWAATTAGAYALSENYLYTVESMRLYWKRLAEGGVLSVSRWMYGPAHVEAARLALLAERALELEGLSEPRAHMALMQGDRVGTLLLSKSPFGAEEVATLDAIAAERGFRRHWPLPRGTRPGSLASVVLTEGPSKFEEKGLFLAPPTDERPFFFQNVRAFSSVSKKLGKLSFNDRAAVLPKLLLGSVALVTLALFFAPFLLAERIERYPFFWRGSSYFVAIGLGFMLVEIPFLQKFILHLGHPSYATTVVLSAILLASGLGSAAAAKLPAARLHRIRFLLPAIVMATSLLAVPICAATLGSSLGVRIAVGFALMCPLGFVLGFAFPTGMIRFGDGNRAWFWAMNGAASVMASVSTVALAAYAGLSGVMWMGAVCYLAACALLPHPRAKQP
jgi:hypothetical protein